MGQRPSSSAAIMGGGLAKAEVLAGGGIRRAGTVGLWGQGYVGMPRELWEAVGGSPFVARQAVEVGVDHAAMLLSIKPTADPLGARGFRARRTDSGRLVTVFVARALEVLAIDPHAKAGRYVAHWDPAWGLVVDLAGPLWLTADVEGYGRGIPYEVNVERVEGAERKVERGKGHRLVRRIPGRGIVSLSVLRAELGQGLGPLAAARGIG